MGNDVGDVSQHRRIVPFVGVRREWPRRKRVFLPATPSTRSFRFLGRVNR
jgi:hypothetical protein